MGWICNPLRKPSGVRIPQPAYKFYFLDFFIEKGNKKIDLEIDGSQHSFRKEHDKERDEFLIKEGYEVYRIDWNDLKSQKGKELMKEKIDKFIYYYNA